MYKDTVNCKRLMDIKNNCINLNGSITMCSQRNTILSSVRQHNHFIIKGNTRLHVSTIT